MTACIGTESISGTPNRGGCGAGRAVPADKAECRLRVQKGDDRRNAPQRARCAESGSWSPIRREKLAFNLSASHLGEGCEHHATTRSPALQQPLNFWSDGWRLSPSLYSHLRG